jgi:hypothetical protein
LGYGIKKPPRRRGEKETLLEGERRNRIRERGRNPVRGGWEGKKPGLKKGWRNPEGGGE